MTTPVPEADNTRVPVTWPVHAVALVGTVMGFLLAPDVDSEQRARDLAPFFSSCAQISATLLVALALFQGALGQTISHRIRRWISPFSFVYLGCSTMTGLSGSIGSFDSSVYQYLFALCAGPGLAGLLTIVLVGYSNIASQREHGPAARAAEIDHSCQDTPR